MNVFPICMPAYHVCSWYTRKSEEGIRYSGTGVIDHCESSCECWEFNPGRRAVSAFN